MRRWCAFAAGSGQGIRSSWSGSGVADGSRLPAGLSVPGQDCRCGALADHRIGPSLRLRVEAASLLDDLGHTVRTRPAPARTHHGTGHPRHDWEHPPHSIERKLLIARDYVTRHGHLPRWAEHHQGLHLSRWLAERRKEANTRRPPHCYQRALNEIYPWWNAKGKAEWKRTYACARAAARDNTLIFPSPHQLTGTVPPLTQWLTQQIDNLDRLEPCQHHLLGDLPMGLDPGFWTPETLGS